MKYAFVHISDIHYKKNQLEAASLVLKAFLLDLKKQKEYYTDYKFYLAFTGDIVFAGAENEAYEKFYKEMNQELIDIGFPKEIRFMVPGNHDIDRSVINNNLDEYKKSIEQNVLTEQSFNNFVCDKNELGCKFENYQLFESILLKMDLIFQ